MQGKDAAADFPNRDQEVTQVENSQVGDYRMHPESVKHETYLPGTGKSTQHSQAARQGICSSSVKETPHAKEQGQAAALNLNVVSDSWAGSEVACTSLQHPRFPGALSAKGHSIPPRIVESPNAVEVATRISEDVDNRTKSVYSIGIQAAAQVESHETQETPFISLQRDKSSNCAFPVNDEAHQSNVRTQGTEVNRRTVAAEQCRACEPAVRDGGNGTVQTCMPQPTAYKSQASQEQQHPSKFAGQSDAETQTPQRQQPKRKLPKKDATPVPVSKRRIDYTPGLTLESLRSPSAAWDRSPTMQRTAQVFGTISLI